LGRLYDATHLSPRKWNAEPRAFVCKEPPAQERRRLPQASAPQAAVSGRKMSAWTLVAVASPRNAPAHEGDGPKTDYSPLYLVHESRFPYTRLSRDQYQPAVSFHRLREVSQERFQLSISTSDIRS
jgi:hypothetical protein